MFARGNRKSWATWGNQADDDYYPDWDTYQNHSQSEERISLAPAKQESTQLDLPVFSKTGH